MNTEVVYICIKTMSYNEYMGPTSFLYIGILLMCKSPSVSPTLHRVNISTSAPSVSPTLHRVNISTSVPSVSPTLLTLYSLQSQY